MSHKIAEVKAELLSAQKAGIEKLEAMIQLQAGAQGYLGPPELPALPSLRIQIIGI